MSLLLWLATARAEVRPETPPEVGVETVLAVLDAEGQGRPGQTVRVVHRPGLAGEKELAIGITDGRGRVRWTPEQPGVARLRAGDETLELAVRGGGAPAPTLVLLGVLLVGGVGSLLFGFGTFRRRTT